MGARIDKILSRDQISFHPYHIAYMLSPGLIRVTYIYSFKMHAYIFYTVLGRLLFIQTHEP